MRLPSSDSLDQPPQQVLVYPTPQQVGSNTSSFANTPPSPGTPVVHPSPTVGTTPATGAPQTYLLGVPSQTQLQQLLPAPVLQQPLQGSPQSSPQQSYSQTPPVQASGPPTGQPVVVLPSSAPSSATASGENTPRQQSLNDSFHQSSAPPGPVLVALPAPIPTAPTLPPPPHHLMPIAQDPAQIHQCPVPFQQQVPAQAPVPYQATKLMAPPAFAQQGAQALNKPPATQLIVNFIASSVSEKDLKRLFEKYGEVENVKILYDKATAKTKGFGFVYFTEYQAAVEAMKGLQGYELKGKCIKIGWANQRQPRASVSAPVPVPIPVPLPGGQIAQMMPPPALFGEANSISANYPAGNGHQNQAPNMPQLVPPSFQQYSGQSQFLHFSQ